MNATRNIYSKVDTRASHLSDIYTHTRVSLTRWGRAPYTCVHERKRIYLAFMRAPGFRGFSSALALYYTSIRARATRGRVESLCALAAAAALSLSLLLSRELLYLYSRSRLCRFRRAGFPYP